MLFFFLPPTSQACAFTKVEEDRPEALQIAFRVFDWLDNIPSHLMEPDAYTYTIMLSVCSNLLPREDRVARYSHGKAFFDKCCQGGYVNDYVLRKLRQTVSEQEYFNLVGPRVVSSGTSGLPPSWTKKIRQKGKHQKHNFRGGASTGGRSKGGRSSYHTRRSQGGGGYR